jgi:glucose-6-phosphate isomerase
MSLAPLRQRPAWQPLESHYEVIRNRHLRELFAEDPQRAEKHDSSTSRLIERYRRLRAAQTGTSG